MNCMEGKIIARESTSHETQSKWNSADKLSGFSLEIVRLPLLLHFLSLCVDPQTIHRCFAVLDWEMASNLK